MQYINIFKNEQIFLLQTVGKEDIWYYLKDIYQLCSRESTSHACSCEWLSICPVFFRCATVGNHVLLWLHVCLGQLLCVHDFLPSVCLTGAGGMGAAFHFICLYVSVNVRLFDRDVFAFVVVPWESGGPSYLAAEPLFQSDGGGGGQQTQPCNTESQNDHGIVSLLLSLVSLF